MATSNRVECPLCGYLSPSISLHISHLRLVHSMDRSFHVTCGIDGCDREYRAFSAFNTHAYRHHRSALGIDSCTPELQIPESSPTQDERAECPIDEDLNSNTSAFEDGQHPGGEAISVQIGEMERKKANAMFLLKLLEKRNVSQVAIGDVIDGCRDLCSQTVAKVKEGVQQSLTEAGVNYNEIEGLGSSLTTIPDPFEGIHSIHLLEKFCMEHFDFMVRIECVPMGVLIYSYTGKHQIESFLTMKLYICLGILIVFCVGASKAPPVLFLSYRTGRRYICSL